MHPPAFLITIDTEGDNGWNRSPDVTTENVRFLPRFQALCERFSFKPTYLTTHEIACDTRFVRFARDILDRGVGEVGMHLHAWTSPPVYELSSADYRHTPYLIEYPTPVLQAKVRQLTARLEDVFGRKMVSHRAGRWAMDERYAEALIEAGYLADCSVTPFVSWRSSRGAPTGEGGPDYRSFPDHAYFLDPENIRRPGSSPLLEVPMTILPRGRISNRRLPGAAYASVLSAKVFGKLIPHDWLRPMRSNREHMLALVDRAAADGRDYIEFMTHSSELMPGGGPYFPDEASIERLYSNLEAVFSAVKERFVGLTLGEFRARFA
jgi:hypothetical protein